MRRTHHHIVAVFFCVLLVLPLLLIIALQLKQLQIQREAKQRLESENLQTIMVDQEKLVWEKKGKEVLVEGELFDVKAIRLENGKYILTGLFDKQETALKKILTRGENLTFSIIQLLLLGQCLALLISGIGMNVRVRVLQKLSTLYKEYPVQLSLAMPGPPPKA